MNNSGLNSRNQPKILIFPSQLLLKNCVSALCAVYLVVFLRAFSRALKILWSHGGVFFPGFMSSALSRAERAEIGRSALGDGGVDGVSMTEGGTAAMITASTSASAVISGSGGGGDGVEASGGGPEMARLGGGVGTALGGLGMISFWLAGLETGRAGVSISSVVSLSGVGTLGAGISGIKAGGGVKSGEAGMVEGGVISSAAKSGKVGMFGRRAFGAEIAGSSGESSMSEGIGISGAGPGMSELGVSRMGSAVNSTESLFDGFLKPRKPFFFSVLALGGGAAGTSSAVRSFCATGSTKGSFLSLLFSFFCFSSDESSSSFSLLPFVDLSLPFFSFPSLLSFPLELVWMVGFLLSFFSSLKTTLGANNVFPSRVWLMEVSREGRAPAGR